MDEPNEATRSEDRAAAAVIDRLRRTRARRDVGVRLDAVLAFQDEAIKKLRRRLGSAGAAWSACCPADLAERTCPSGLKAGVLRVGVNDASTRYRVDRWLRSGGLDELQRASAAPLRRVWLEIRQDGTQA